MACNSRGAKTTALGCTSIARGTTGPAIMRFVSEDPIGFLGGYNVYRYVEDNPINRDYLF
jgi:RHS repeat-associated protein